MTHSKRGAIALMITLFFIIAISVSLGIALKQVKSVSTEVSKQKFAMQSSILVDDVLNLLKTSPDLEAINSVDTLFIFLSEAAFIPFESSGVKMLIEIKSARSKLNINTLVDIKGSALVPNPAKVEALSQYMAHYNVNPSYTDMIVDSMSKIKADNSYYSDIFNENPYLFRDYIASRKHLETINDFYAKTYNENTLQKINFEKLFSFSKQRDSKIDLNYATKETWRLLLGCDELRAEQLSLGAGAYAVEADLGLAPEEILALHRFNVAYLEMFLDVKVTIQSAHLSSELRFEYDMSKKKGSNFVYEI